MGNASQQQALQFRQSSAPHDDQVGVCCLCGIEDIHHWFAVVERHLDGLAEMEIPERGQPSGTKARKALADLAFGKMSIAYTSLKPNSFAYRGAANAPYYFRENYIHSRRAK